MPLAFVRALAGSLARTLRRPPLPGWLQTLLQKRADHPTFVLLVALVGLVCTVTFSFPFSLVLMTATLLAPRRWLALSLCSGVAAGIGAVILVEVFHHLGWAQIALRWPELAQSPEMGQMQQWVSDWGILALGAVAASPLPQTPALVLCALAEQPPLAVFLAVTLAKMTKYGCIAWLTRQAVPRRD